MRKKPWDFLRVSNDPPPIAGGTWLTTSTNAHVSCRIATTNGVTLSFPNIDPYFRSSDLRELAEFCNELADQIDEN